MCARDDTLNSVECGGSRGGNFTDADVVVVGGGAAGLMAAIWAGRGFGECGGGSATGKTKRVVILDGAKRIGAKILVSGGGRCNVTHERVAAEAFAGSSKNAIARVLKRFGVEETLEFFREIGVELKREETGKLFPITGSARTVLDALLSAASGAGVEVLTSRRVDSIEVLRGEGGEGARRFVLRGESWGAMVARRVILAAGGKALPKSGSDGSGYLLAKALGHSMTERIFPALVPLTFSSEHFLRQLPGVSFEGALTVRSSTGKKMATMRGSVLCTHFGISGPAVLDVSRYYLDAKAGDSGVSLVAHYLPGRSFEEVDEWLRDSRGGGRTAVGLLRDVLPERLARGIVAFALAFGDESRVNVVKCANMRRDDRKRLAHALTEMTLPITGHRGFKAAEVTAGGVGLNELNIKRMESRLCSGLYFCGEILDVDGRIGGFNFQWAWSSGYVAGVSAARDLVGGDSVEDDR